MVNQKTLDPLNCIALVRNYFKVHLPDYKLDVEGSYTGYWWLEFSNPLENCIVKFDGDIGGVFSVIIVIDDKNYDLWQFDKSVNALRHSTKENINYHLEVLKTFLANSKRN
jgi:hypothetical protein